MTKFYLIALFLVSFAARSQSAERLLRFKVVADSVAVDGINVVNLVNERTAITDRNGEFSIYAKVDDLLVLTAVNFEYKRKIIDDDDLKKTIIIIKMTSKITQLDEVVIKEQQITAEKLGIVPAGQKRYTQAERKLYTAQTGPIDIVANLISGRTKQLKKELEISKKELLLQKVEFLYDDKYYIETLKIQPDYIKGFQYYLIENPQFVDALKSKNKTLTMFYASKLASEYNKTIKTN